MIQSLKMEKTLLNVLATMITERIANRYEANLMFAEKSIENKARETQCEKSTYEINRRFPDFIEYLLYLGEYAQM